MSMFVHKGGGGVKKPGKTVHMVCRWRLSRWDIYSDSKVWNCLVGPKCECKRASVEKFSILCNLTHKHHTAEIKFFPFSFWFAQSRKLDFSFHKESSGWCTRKCFAKSYQFKSCISFSFLTFMEENNNFLRRLSFYC